VETKQHATAAPAAVDEEQPLALEDETYPATNDDLSPPAEEPAPRQFAPLPDARSGGAPKWATVPPNLKFPRGRQVAFIRFKAEWTDAPHRGDRQCIVWGLTDIDEKVALGRAIGDPNRAANELAKQMIRSVDGHVVDWSGDPGPGNIDQWWREVGGKCRQMLIRIYTQLHVLSEDDRRTFFESCIELRTTG